MARVEIRDSRVFRPGQKLKRIARALQAPTDAVKQVGVIVMAESRNAFPKQGFNGAKWKPRAIPNVYGILRDLKMGRTEIPNRRFQNKRTLIDTGRLNQSISYRVINPTTVEIGTNLPYASTLNFGGKIESEKITKSMQKRLGKWLSGKGKKWQNKLGFLLTPAKVGTKLKGRVEPRQFVGLTKTARKDILESLGIRIFEAK